MLTQQRIGEGELGGHVGPYRLLEPLGEGGMGIVYRARHQETHKTVALKVVRVGDETLLSSFRREIFALRCIEHPQVVRIVDDGVDRGSPWYAMELLRGHTLADYVDDMHLEAGPMSGARRTPGREPKSGVADAEAPTLPPATEPASIRLVPRLEDTLTIMRALCAPLAYVHGAGIVHRDLKPENILIQSDGRPIILDFGLALHFWGGEGSRDVLDVAGRALGTPPYMAPEQIRGDLVDARADLYALGCMLFECLTGRPPFEGTPVGTLQKHLGEPPPLASSLALGVPQELDELIERLLSKRPRDRIGFAVDVAAVLKELGARELPEVSAPQPRPYLYRPSLAGRASVVNELKPILQRSAGACGSCVLVGGESGVGKTRLAMELATWAARRGVNVVTGQCLDTRADGGGLSIKAAPLHPLRPLLHAIADRCRIEGIDETERVLADRGPVLAPYAPILSQLVGQKRLAPPAELSAEAARYRLLDALATSLARLSEAQPMFLVVDDLQWADELTLAFLRHVDADYFVSTDVFIVGTYRNDEMTPALRGVLDSDHVRGVHLGLLARDAVGEMVSDMLALDEPPDALVEFLMSESEGNPFFIAEYLRAAIGERVLRRSQTGVWLVGTAAETSDSLRDALPLPGGLRDLVARRLSALREDARSLLDVAAVLGRQIDGDVLTAASGMEEGARAAMHALRARQVLEEDDKGGLRFIHDKVREIVYASIGSERLPGLHLAAARAIEVEARDEASRSLQYGVLAHHFTLGGDLARAVHYLERAGELALSSAASGEAKRFYATAISLAESGGLDVEERRRAGWLRRLGEAHYNLGELVEAKHALHASLDILHRSPVVSLPLVDEAQTRAVLTSATAVVAQLKTLVGADHAVSQRPETRARFREGALAAERLSQVHYFLNEQNQAFAAALRCAQLAEGLGPSPELARAYATLSVAMNFVPVPGLMDRYGNMAEDIASQVDDSQATGFVAFLRGLNDCGAGRWRSARTHLETALDIALGNGDVRTAQEVRTLLLDALVFMGECDEAFRHLHTLVESAERTHNIQAIGWGKGSFAFAYALLGRAAEALRYFEEASALNAETGDTTSMLVEAYRAFAHMMVGDWENARRVAEVARSLSGPPPAAWHCCQGYIGAAEVYLAQWERSTVRDEARAGTDQLATEAVAVLERAARVFPWASSSALRMRGLHHWLCGNPRRAMRRWRQAIEVARDMEMPFEEARAHFEIARHIESPRKRAEHAREARLIYERVGADRWVELTMQLPRCWA